MRLARRFVFLIAGGAVLAPLFAFGHACEFLVARLELKDAVLRLEITADYGENPMIADENEARQALQRILEVKTRARRCALEDLAPLKMTHQTAWDPATPAAFSPPPDGRAHELLTACWEWQAPPGEELTLGVPKGNLHDVLLWTQDSHLPGKQVKWMLLIEGESIPPIRIPTVAFSWGTILGLGFVGGLILALPGWMLWRRRMRQGRGENGVAPK